MMKTSDKIKSIIFAFNKNDNRREEVINLGNNVASLEAIAKLAFEISNAWDELGFEGAANRDVIIKKIKKLQKNNKLDL